MQHFEYTVRDYNSNGMTRTINQLLNEMASEGWKLVSVVSVVRWNEPMYRHYFERAVDET